MKNVEKCKISQQQKRKEFLSTSKVKIMQKEWQKKLDLMHHPSAKKKERRKKKEQRV